MAYLTGRETPLQANGGGAASAGGDAPRGVGTLQRDQTGEETGDFHDHE
jgi:hypothetical protein